MCAFILWHEPLQGNNRLRSSPHPHVAWGALEEGVLQTTKHSRPLLQAVTYLAQAHVVALSRPGGEGNDKTAQAFCTGFGSQTGPYFRELQLCT